MFTRIEAHHTEKRLAESLANTIMLEASDVRKSTPPFGPHTVGTPSVEPSASATETPSGQQRRSRRRQRRPSPLSSEISQIENDISREETTMLNGDQAYVFHYWGG